MDDFMELSPKTSLNNGHIFCGMELEHTKRFLGLSYHFTAMSTVTPLVAIVRVTSLLSHATKVKCFLQLYVVSICRLVSVK
jgi:hypothetical protein